MKGAIIINGYYENESAIHQSKRLKQELEALSVEVSIIKSNEVLTLIDEGEPHVLSLTKDAEGIYGADFVVYLNKDRYQAEVLEKCGYKLFNSANAIIVCDDKMLTFTTLAGGGVRMPKTISSPIMYSENDDEIFLRSVEESLGYPIIVKNVFGSMGKGVFKVDNFEELKTIFKKLRMLPHLYQQAVGTLGKDTRIIVIGGKVIGAIERRSADDFRSNVELGGSASSVIVTEEQGELAKEVVRLLGLDYAGVDILTGSDGEYVCEVNSNAFFNGMEQATGINVAKHYAEYIIKKVNGEI